MGLEDSNEEVRRSGRPYRVRRFCIGDDKWVTEYYYADGAPNAFRQRDPGPSPGRPVASNPMRAGDGLRMIGISASAIVPVVSVAYLGFPKTLLLGALAWGLFHGFRRAREKKP